MREDLYVPVSGRFDNEVTNLKRYNVTDDFYLIEAPWRLLGDAGNQLGEEVDRAIKSWTPKHTPFAVVKGAEWVYRETPAGRVPVTPRTAANSLFGQPVPGMNAPRVYPEFCLFMAGLELVKPFGFNFPFQVGVRTDSQGRRYFSYNGELTMKSMALSDCQALDELPVFGRRDVFQGIRLYRRIKRIGAESHPRVARALGLYTRALFIEEWDWLILTYWSMLETLFSTDPFEVSHQLGERIAAVTCQDRMARAEEYRRIKRLYGVRSKIVHGRGVQLGHQDARRALLDLSDLCRRSVVAVLDDVELLGTYEASSDGAVSQTLRDLLTSRVLS